jgi:hypothetical protein
MTQHRLVEKMVAGGKFGADYGLTESDLTSNFSDDWVKGEHPATLSHWHGSIPMTYVGKTNRGWHVFRKHDPDAYDDESGQAEPKPLVVSQHAGRDYKGKHPFSVSQHNVDHIVLPYNQREHGVVSY